MRGQRMHSVRETLHIFLRSLPERTLFNIIGFGTNTVSLFPESREYNGTILLQYHVCALCCVFCARGVVNDR